MTRCIMHIILGAIVLTLSSCASMFNSKQTSVTILTSEPSKLVIDNDTIRYRLGNNSFTFDRDKKPITVTAYNESLSKTVNIKSKNSFAYWLNLYPNWHFWTGFHIDTKTKKRYTYPKTVYIDLTVNDSSYLTYKPLHYPFNSYANILKITPLKLVGTVNPSTELSYERRTGGSFSTQLMASYLLPISFVDIGNDFSTETKGFRVAIEEKYYFKKSAPLGPYMGLEVNYLSNQYKSIWYFGEKNTFSDTTSSFTNYPDTFGIKKQTYSFNLKLGNQLIINRLAIDFYAGFGLKNKNVRHFDRINPNDEMEMPRHPNIYYITNLEGKYWTVSMPLNVRIGWTF